MKSTLKIFLVIALFSSIALADGDMSNGGFADDGDMSNGGRACGQNCQIADQTAKKDQGSDSLLGYVQDFLAKILG